LPATPASFPASFACLQHLLSLLLPTIQHVSPQEHRTIYTGRLRKQRELRGSWSSGRMLGYFFFFAGDALTVVALSLSFANLCIPTARHMCQPLALRPRPHTLHPTPYTLHPTPCTLHPIKFVHTYRAPHETEKKIGEVTCVSTYGEAISHEPSWPYP
jgi:hypothetical protein